MVPKILANDINNLSGTGRTVAVCSRSESWCEEVLTICLRVRNDSLESQKLEVTLVAPRFKYSDSSI